MSGDGKTAGAVGAVVNRAESMLGRHGRIQTQQTITIGRARAELLEFFTDAEHLSRIVGQVATVGEPSPGQYVWATGEQGIQTTLERSGETLAWAAAGDAPDRWSLAFSEAPAGLGTEVRLQVDVASLPTLPGTLGELAAGGLLLKLLHRAKALVETGEIPTLKHNPAARGDGADHDEN